VRVCVCMCVCVCVCVRACACLHVRVCLCVWQNEQIEYLLCPPQPLSITRQIPAVFSIQFEHCQVYLHSPLSQEFTGCPYLMTPPPHQSPETLIIRTQHWGVEWHLILLPPPFTLPLQKRSVHLKHSRLAELCWFGRSDVRVTNVTAQYLSVSELFTPPPGCVALRSSIMSYSFHSHKSSVVQDRLFLKRRRLRSSRGRMHDSIHGGVFCSHKALLRECIHRPPGVAFFHLYFFICFKLTKASSVDAVCRRAIVTDAAVDARPGFYSPPRLLWELKGCVPVDWMMPGRTSSLCLAVFTHSYCSGRV